METANNIDFSYSYLEAKKALKSMHDCTLDKKYNEALEHALKGITELRMACNAIRHEKETHNVIR